MIFESINPKKHKIKIGMKVFAYVNNKRVEVEIFGWYRVKDFGTVYQIRKLTTPYRPLELLRKQNHLFVRID